MASRGAASSEHLERLHDIFRALHADLGGAAQRLRHGAAGGCCCGGRPGTGRGCGPQRPRAARPRLTAPQLGRGRGRGRARGLRWGRGLRRAPGNRVKERGMARTALGGTARRSPAGRCAGAVELGQGSPELCCARARSSELWARTGCLQAAFFQCL